MYGHDMVERWILGVPFTAEDEPRPGCLRPGKRAVRAEARFASKTTYEDIITGADGWNRFPEVPVEKPLGKLLLAEGF